MESNDTGTHGLLKKEIEANRELLEENNKLLKQIHRNDVWSFWLRIVWFAAIIGLPFALYFYVFEPYFTALGSSYSTFEAGVQEIPGLKQFSEFMQAYKESDN